MTNSNRKCFSSIPSSYASVYLITAFFAISLFSLLYLKYPQTQQYFNQFEYLKIVNNHPTIEPRPIPLSDNDLTAPSVNVFRADVVDTAARPPNPPLLSDSKLPPPSAVKSPPQNSTADLQEKTDNQQPPLPVGETPVSVAVNSSVVQRTGIVEKAATEKHDKSPTFPPPAANPKEENGKPHLTPIPVRPKPATVNPTAEKQEEDGHGEDDDRIIPSVDPLAFPPGISTKEGRIEWIKQKLPVSKILESTPSTRKFDEKMQQFISTNRCRVNIFLTWISSTKLFGKRELYALETILKAHPYGCVFIISRIMASKPGRELIQPLVDRGHLILPIAPDFPLMFSRTPAHDWLERLKTGRMDPGNIPITQNLSNLLRLVVLYKYGGVYFDTDMIILKDVSALRNTIGIQKVDEQRKTWLSVNNAVLIFDKEHPLLFKFMEEFNLSFDGNLWGYNGPDMATRIIKQIMHDSRYQFNVMSPMAFYPIDWSNINRFFRDPRDDKAWAEDMFGKVSRESYGVHLWNKFSGPWKVERGSMIGKLISDHCIICQDVYDS